MAKASNSEKPVSNSPKNETPANPDSNSKKAEKSEKTVIIFSMQIRMKKLMDNGFLYVFGGVLLLIFLFSLLTDSNVEKISLSQFVQDTRENKINKVEVAGNELRLFYDDDVRKITRKEDNQELLSVLEASDIDLASLDMDVKNLSFGEMVWEFILAIIPLVLVTGVLFFLLFRQARGAPDGTMGMGRSKAKLFVKGKQNISFKNVGGMDEAKQELEEIVDFLKDPKKYHKVGARTPKGVLLVGPSGTGKTL